MAQPADALTPPQLIESMSNGIIHDVQSDPKLRSVIPELPRPEASRIVVEGQEHPAVRSELRPLRRGEAEVLPG